MAGNENGGYAISESEKFKADVKYLCSEIGVGLEHVETIVNVVRLAALRKPRDLPPVPSSPDKRFVFTQRVNRNGIEVPSLRVLIKIFQEEHRIELLALTSRDVRL
jgi:hypothetical protein